MGFSKSADVYADGSVVAVPLPGHTPGSVGVFVRTSIGLLFDVGDAVFVGEAIDAGAPKHPMLRSFADQNPAGADEQVRILSAFKRAHPEVHILVAHDRSTWLSTFKSGPGCI